MPKKTKKQKIASERRKLHFSGKNQAQPISVSQPINEKIDGPVSKPVIISQPKETNTVTTTIFKKDLMKSLAISGGILALVFGIYLQQTFGILPINSLIK
jgi:hypothetical protein